MTTLVVVAVDLERDAVLRDLTGGVEVDVRVSGVGPVAAATTTTQALAARTYDLVLSAGIGGAFSGRAAVGDIVVADTSIAADLGCRTADGLLTLRDMGLGQDSSVALGDWSKWRDRLVDAGLPAQTGEVLTLSCMTGTDDEAQDLARRFPRAVAEGMEGWGVVWPCHTTADPVKVGEIRAISNVIGRRDHAAWDLDGALDVLARTFGVLLAEPLP